MTTMSPFYSSAMGGEASVRLQAAGHALYEQHGHALLDPRSQLELRMLAVRNTAPLCEQALLTPPSGPPLSTAVPLNPALAAGSGLAKAAGLGAALDGAVAAAQAGVALGRGQTSLGEACAHVAVESATGAVASASGAAMGLALSAVTGALPAGAAFVVGAGTALVVKHALLDVLRG